MSGIAHRQVANTQVLNTHAVIPTCAPRPRLSFSQQRTILAGSPTATRPRPIHLPSLKYSAQNDASSIMYHITATITYAQREGAHTTRISFTIPMRRLAAENGVPFIIDTLLIKILSVPKVTARRTQPRCIIKTSLRAVRLQNVLPQASSSILLSITAR